ncbi:hypothetical protein F5Y14DRAFT_425115 [Nemania sp. NC0429]|nr:hypothetical protein F5Y14DRAFT_425115 [Nemania sp. NC0429]
MSEGNPDGHVSEARGDERRESPTIPAVVVAIPSSIPSQPLLGKVFHVHLIHGLLAYLRARVALLATVFLVVAARARTAAPKVVFLKGAFLHGGFVKGLFAPQPGLASPQVRITGRTQRYCYDFEAHDRGGKGRGGEAWPIDWSTLALWLRESAGCDWRVMVR